MKYLLVGWLALFGSSAVVMADEVPGQAQLQDVIATSEQIREQYTQWVEQGKPKQGAQIEQIDRLHQRLTAQLQLAAEQGNGVALYWQGGLLEPGAQRAQACALYRQAGDAGLLAGRLAALNCQMRDLAQRPDPLREELAEKLRQALEVPDPYASYYGMAIQRSACFGRARQDMSTLSMDELRDYLAPVTLDEQQFRIEAKYVLALNAIMLKGKEGYAEAQRYGTQALEAGCNGDDGFLKDLLDSAKP